MAGALDIESAASPAGVWRFIEALEGQSSGAPPYDYRPRESTQTTAPEVLGAALLVEASCSAADERNAVGSGEATELTFAEVFRRRLEAWKARVPTSSSNVAKMFQRPEYRAVVGLGSEAIPLLLNELRREPDYWFAALQELTGAQPVPKSAYGNLYEMTEAWLRWGREHDHIQ